MYLLTDLPMQCALSQAAAAPTASRLRLHCLSHSYYSCHCGP